MSRLLYRFIASGALMAAVTTSLFAQANVHAHDHDHSDGNILCGSILLNDGKDYEALEKTRLNRPELYQRMVERAKSTVDRRSILSAGDEDIFPFVIRNRVTGMYDEILAKLVFQGKWARIWVDTRDTGRTRVKNIISGLAKGLDTATGSTSRNRNKGIIENDQEVFGMPPVNNFDPTSPVQDFLLTDIEDGMTGGFVGGFFSPWDQTNNPGSNKMNLLYIDSNQGVNSGLTSLLSTLAHEFQHLIHYRANPQSETMFNEGCSEEASILLGYKDRANRSYLNNVNVSMFKWSHDDQTGQLLEIDYQRAMTFVHYMTEQYGEGFLKVLLETKSENMERVADALRTLGINPDWQSMMANFVAANYLGSDFPSDSKLSYRTKLWSGTKPSATVHNTYTGTSFPNSGSMVVQQYAGIYNVYNNPGGLKVKFRASQPIRVMAILYKGTAPVEVWALENDQEYSIVQNGSTPYDKIVFAVANLSFNAQTVNWTVNGITLGVEDNAATASALAVSEIAPNPVSGSARVTFSNAVSGPVNIALYNPKGELVQTLVDGDRYEAGQHELTMNTSDMPNGIYMVRVVQNGQAASRVVVVMNK